MEPRLSVSQITTFRSTFAEDVRRYAAAGLDGIGIWELKLPDGGDAEALEALEASAAGDVRGTLRAHTEFHFALYDAAASPWLVALIRPAWHRSERYRPALLATPGEPQTEHRAVEQRLLEACVAHDPAAAATALHDHLELASPIFEHELGGRGIFERV